MVVLYIKAFLTFLAFHCNHIKKLNSPKKEGGLNKEGWGATTL